MWCSLCVCLSVCLSACLSVCLSVCVPGRLSGSQVMPSSMPPPRKLPQRPWAASIPTVLTHSALHVLLLPSPTPCLVPGLACSYLCSPLERFLGSVIMRRHLQRIIQGEPNVSVDWSAGSLCAEGVMVRACDAAALYSFIIHQLVKIGFFWNGPSFWPTFLVRVCACVCY